MAYVVVESLDEMSKAFFHVSRNVIVTNLWLAVKAVRIAVRQDPLRLKFEGK